MYLLYYHPAKWIPEYMLYTSHPAPTTITDKATVADRFRDKFDLIHCTSVSAR